MSPDDVRNLLVEALPGAEIRVSIDGSHYNLVVISDLFQGVRAVRRQQMVYAALGRQIAEGVIHAVNMLTFTQSEWDKRQ